MHALELKIPPPLVGAALAAAMWWLSLRLPLFALDPALRIAVGLACALAGAAIAASGVMAFRRARTTVNPHKPENASAMVTGGVYRLTRNPMYLGMTAVLLGWAAYLAVPWGFLGPALFALYITRFQIIPEERILAAKFGAEYETYRSRVRRWI